MNPTSIPRLSAAIGAGALTVGGAAFAATSQLPDDLPDRARAGEHATAPTRTEAEQAGAVEQAERGENADADLASDDVTSETDPEANDHGQTVSTFARETDLEGREKGQAVAERASAHRADVTSDEATENARVAGDAADEDAAAEDDGSRETGEQASAEGRARAGDARDDG